MRYQNAISRPVLAVMLLSVCMALAGMTSASHESLGPSTVSAPSSQVNPFRGWSSLGRPGSYSLGLPARGINLDGRQELFTIGSNGEVWHAWQTTPSGLWSGWIDFSGTGTSYCVTVASNADGRMELFALWYDLAVWHTRQGLPNSPFGSWQTFGWPQNTVSLTCPQVGRNADGRLEVFSIGSDGNLWTMPQAAPSGGWASWAYLGKPSGRTICCLAWGNDYDSREAIYALGDDNAIYLNFQIYTNDGWSGWYPFPRPSGVNLYAPAIGWNQDGRQELFAIGDDGNLWTLWQATPNSDLTWVGWANLGKPPTGTLRQNRKPVVGQSGTPEIKMEVFAQSNDGAFWHIGQIGANDGWGKWSSLGQPPVGLGDSDAAIGNNNNGQLVFFAVGNDGAIWENPAGAALYLPLIVR